MSRRPHGWRSAIPPWCIFPRRVAATEPRLEPARCAVDTGQGCRLAYQVKDEDTGAATFVAVNLDPKSWSQHDFRSDPACPGSLPPPTRRLVSERLGSVVEEPILHCRVQPVRYRPGTRCVLRYDVRTASGAARYYAKVFSTVGLR